MSTTAEVQIYWSRDYIPRGNLSFFGSSQLPHSLSITFFHQLLLKHCADNPLSCGGDTTILVEPDYRTSMSTPGSPVAGESSASRPTDFKPPTTLASAVLNGQSGSGPSSGRKRKASAVPDEQRDSLRDDSHTDDDGASVRPGREHKRTRVHFSCVECHRRKQKCDRKEPCSQCVARKVPHLCRPFLNGVEDPSTRVVKSMSRYLR